LDLLRQAETPASLDSKDKCNEKKELERKKKEFEAEIKAEKDSVDKLKDFPRTKPNTGFWLPVAGPNTSTNCTNIPISVSYGRKYQVLASYMSEESLREMLGTVAWHDWADDGSTDEFFTPLRELALFVQYYPQSIDVVENFVGPTSEADVKISQDLKDSGILGSHKLFMGDGCDILRDRVFCRMKLQEIQNEPTWRLLTHLATFIPSVPLRNSTPIDLAGTDDANPLRKRSTQEVLNDADIIAVFTGNRSLSFAADSVKNSLKAQSKRFLSNSCKFVFVCSRERENPMSTESFARRGEQDILEETKYQEEIIKNTRDDLFKLLSRRPGNCQAPVAERKLLRQLADSTIVTVSRPMLACSSLLRDEMNTIVDRRPIFELFAASNGERLATPLRALADYLQHVLTFEPPSHDVPTGEKKRIGDKIKDFGKKIPMFKHPVILDLAECFQSDCKAPLPKPMEKLVTPELTCAFSNFFGDAKFIECILDDAQNNEIKAAVQSFKTINANEQGRQAMLQPLLAEDLSRPFFDIVCSGTLTSFNSFRDRNLATFKKIFHERLFKIVVDFLGVKKKDEAALQLIKKAVTAQEPTIDLLLRPLKAFDAKKHCRDTVIQYFKTSQRLIGVKKTRMKVPDILQLIEDKFYSGFVSEYPKLVVENLTTKWLEAGRSVLAKLGFREEIFIGRGKAYSLFESIVLAVRTSLIGQSNDDLKDVKEIKRLLDNNLRDWRSALEGRAKEEANFMDDEVKKMRNAQRLCETKLKDTIQAVLQDKLKLIQPQSVDYLFQQLDGCASYLDQLKDKKNLNSLSNTPYPGKIYSGQPDDLTVYGADDLTLYGALMRCLVVLTLDKQFKDSVVGVVHAILSEVRLLTRDNSDGKAVLFGMRQDQIVSFAQAILNNSNISDSDRSRFESIVIQLMANVTKCAFHLFVPRLPSATDSKQYNVFVFIPAGTSAIAHSKAYRLAWIRHGSIDNPAYRYVAIKEAVANITITDSVTSRDITVSGPDLKGQREHYREIKKEKNQLISRSDEITQSLQNRFQWAWIKTKNNDGKEVKVASTVMSANEEFVTRCTYACSQDAIENSRKASGNRSHKGSKTPEVDYTDWQLTTEEKAKEHGYIQPMSDKWLDEVFEHEQESQRQSDEHLIQAQRICAHLDRSMRIALKPLVSEEKIGRNDSGVRALLDAFRDALPFRYNDYQTKNPDLLSWLRNGVSDEARKLIKLNEGDSENSYWSSYVDMLDQAPFIHFALQAAALFLHINIHVYESEQFNENHNEWKLHMTGSSYPFATISLVHVGSFVFIPLSKVKSHSENSAPAGGRSGVAADTVTDNGPYSRPKRVLLLGRPDGSGSPTKRVKFGTASPTSSAPAGGRSGVAADTVTDNGPYSTPKRVLLLTRPDGSGSPTKRVKFGTASPTSSSFGSSGDSSGRSIGTSQSNERKKKREGDPRMRPIQVSPAISTNSQATKETEYDEPRLIIEDLDEPNPVPGSS